MASPASHIHPPVQPPVSQPEWLTVQEAVALGYGGYSTLRRRIATGELVAAKIGQQIRLRREDLDALLVPAREQTFEDVETAVERIVASAPPLTDEQCRRLASLFDGAS